MAGIVLLIDLKLDGHAWKRICILSEAHCTICREAAGILLDYSCHQFDESKSELDMYLSGIKAD